MGGVDEKNATKKWKEGVHGMTEKCRIMYQTLRETDCTLVKTCCESHEGN